MYADRDDVREIDIKVRLSNNEYRKFVAAIRQRKGPAATVARDLILERLAMVEDCIQEKAA